MDNKAFDSKRIALGYANDRPWLHKEVLHMIAQDLDLKKYFKHGLDVGCGAGLSTKALKLICDKVTGIDISDEMVEVCKVLYPEPEYSFFTSSAEEICPPIEHSETMSASESECESIHDERRMSIMNKVHDIMDVSKLECESTHDEQRMSIMNEVYDIVTAAGVVNWVDESIFLRRLSEVMKEKGILCIYDFWITDRMTGVEKYTKWWHNEYLSRYPKPARKENIWTQDEMQAGLRIEDQKEIKLKYEFTMDAFIRFMMTQSNVNEKIRQGLETEEGASAWFAESLQKIFSDKTQELEFAGYIWYIRKSKCR